MSYHLNVPAFVYGLTVALVSNWIADRLGYRLQLLGRITLSLMAALCGLGILALLRLIR